MDKDVYRRMARQEPDHWWFVARRSILKQMIREYGPNSEAVEILEAGCGSGGNLNLLSEFGTVYGFELDEDACEIAKQSGTRIEKGRLPDENPFADKAFDIIALFDVLEHVEEDRDSLISLAACLKPNGRIFITVPSMPWLWSHHDVRHHHFRRYRKSSLKQLLEEAGFDIIRLSYYNFFLFPLIAMTRAFHILTRSTKSDDEDMPANWINRLLCRIFASEGRLLPKTNLPIGISLMAIAKPIETQALE